MKLCWKAMGGTPGSYVRGPLTAQQKNFCGWELMNCVTCPSKCRSFTSRIQTNQGHYLKDNKNKI